MLTFHRKSETKKERERERENERKLFLTVVYLHRWSRWSVFYYLISWVIFFVRSLSIFFSFFSSVVRVLIFVRRINRRRRTKKEPIIGTDGFRWPLIRADRTKLQINHTQRRFFLMINEFSTMNSSIYRPFGFSFIIQFNSSLVNKEKEREKLVSKVNIFEY